MELVKCPDCEKEVKGLPQHKRFCKANKAEKEPEIEPAKEAPVQRDTILLQNKLSVPYEDAGVKAEVRCPKCKGTAVIYRKAKHSARIIYQCTNRAACKTFLFSPPMKEVV